MTHAQPLLIGSFLLLSCLWGLSTYLQEKGEALENSLKALKTQIVSRTQDQNLFHKTRPYHTALQTSPPLKISDLISILKILPLKEMHYKITPLPPQALKVTGYKVFLTFKGTHESDGVTLASKLQKSLPGYIIPQNLTLKRLNESVPLFSGECTFDWILPLKEAL